MAGIKKYWLRLLITFVGSFIVSCVLLRLYSGNLSVTGMNFCRFEIIFIVVAFISIHFVFKINLIYDFIFKYRWLLGLALLIFVVGNKFSGSSIGMYNYYVQPGMGSQYVDTVLGVPRDIRSDEWLVSTPGRLSAFQTDDTFAKYNPLMRGTDTLSDLSIDVKLTGVNIFKYCYALLGRDYGFSCYWFLPIILAFLVNFEFFYILTRQDRLVSLTGASLVVFSAFYTWWSSPMQLLYVPATLVCFYYFIVSNKLYQKILFALGLAFSFVGYVVALYPAWEVPLGYTALIIAACMIHECWDRIKKLGWKSWLVFGAALCIGLLMLYGYLTDYLAPYSAGISETVYPGQRLSSGGPENGFNAINKLFYPFQQLLYPFLNTGNNCEAGGFLCFFPISFIMLAYQWFKDKKKDWLKTGLILIVAFFTTYVAVGIPMTLARISLLSYSTSSRLVDIIGYLSVIALIIVLARRDDYKGLPPVAGAYLSSVYSVVCIYVCRKWYPDFMPAKYTIIMAVIVAFLVYCIIVRTSVKLKKAACVVIIMMSAVTALPVHPVMKGLDVIYSKPVSKEIMSITKENDDKWITCGGGIVFSSYSLLCGAPTVNYTNIYPNLELWKTLDPNGQYNEVYNRYAHVQVEFTDEATSFELIGTDYMLLKLSYADMSKTEVGYILSDHALDVDNEFVTFEKIYDEAGCLIYHVKYKQYDKEELKL